MSKKLSANLISLSAMTEVGYTAIFKKDIGILTTPYNQKIRLERDTSDMWVFPQDTTNVNGKRIIPRMRHDVDSLPEGRVSKHSTAKSKKATPTRTKYRPEVASALRQDHSLHKGLKVNFLKDAT